MKKPNKRITRKGTGDVKTVSDNKTGKHSYCSMPKTVERVFGPDVNPNRAGLIRKIEKKWANGTVLHYYFFDKSSDGEYVYYTNGTRKWVGWTTQEAEKKIVRRAFDIWKKVGIGLEFKEVKSREDAEIRIGFMRGDGAWSYIGRDINGIAEDERTMNFGWDLTRQASEIDTAIHEIGHTLGFPHEHQNPNAGIVWDEESVYSDLAKPPNEWSRETTYHNIIKKIDPDTVQGSNWDPNSIMHYPFDSGMIKIPEKYYTSGLEPDPGLSKRDKTWVKSFYPPLKKNDYIDLLPFRSVQMSIKAGEQINFNIKPVATRYYNISTFGTSDTLMVLFENENGENRYRTADDDSGTGYNAKIRTKLIKGRSYVLRVRLYYSNRSGGTAVMMW
ncbi:matrixin family [Candidatus Scalindua japonica]|uniref:Matrixin family n=1 Tax=Candidatus Scalindua japonica TaxID=1284222 RepID=A0A286TTX8_9BACT|nr:M12 family metallopeptidase [Candidatus Scalindua japonica]GAX59337.1 matrixin family [Candidatus Scalindua japonica]